MALQNKPDLTEVWASGGASVKPSDEKIQLGWVAEVPPFQYENWIQSRQDQFLAHINQRGIPVWDGLTDYEGGGLSYVQGSNGVVYKSVAASGPTGVTQDPTTDAESTHWQAAFADKTTQVIAGTGLSGGGSLATNRTLSVDFATPEQAQALTAGDVAITPKTLADAFGGGNRSLSTNGWQRLPGGLIIQWVRADVHEGQTITLPIAFTTAFLSVVDGGGNPNHTGNVEVLQTLPVAGSLSQFRVGAAYWVNGEFISITSSNRMDSTFIAIGY